MKLDELFSGLRQSTRFLSRPRMTAELEQLTARLAAEGLDELAEAGAEQDRLRADVETLKTELGRVWDGKHDLADRLRAADRVNAILRAEVEVERRKLASIAEFVSPRAAGRG